MQQARDIAVVGAGPAGLAAAIYLARAGHRITIFERFERPAPVGSGLILQPTGLTVLHDLGLLDEMLVLGARIDRLKGVDATTGRTVLDVRYGAQPKGRFGLAVHRAALFGVLYRAAKRERIALETGGEIETIDVGAGKAALHTAKGGTVGRFDLVVDASGARSRLRRFASGPAEPKPLPYGAFWASLEWRSEGFDPHALLQRYDRASIMAGVLPIGRPEPDKPNMAAFFWSVKPADVPKLKAGGMEAWKNCVAGIWPECQSYLQQIHSFDELTLARYGHHTMPRPVGRSLAVIGDSAHSTSPQLGQGANMALLDARALAHAVATSADVSGALDLYATSRRRHVRVFQILSWMFTPFYQSDSTVLPMIRDRLVATIARVPPAPQFLASMVAGTVVDPFAPIGLREKAWVETAALTLAHASR